MFFDADKTPWWKVYNLLETIANLCGIHKCIYWINQQIFIEMANVFLERDMSGYRFVNGQLAPISNKQEIEAIQESVQKAMEKGLDGTRQHLETAIGLMSKRPDPDYRNSIKESISAIESLSKQVTGETGGGLEKALDKLDQVVHFHRAFKSGLLKLYGYTSDEDGIRHAILAEPDLGLEEAKFMLVTCSALVNFIIMKAEKAGFKVTD